MDQLGIERNMSNILSPFNIMKPRFGSLQCEASFDKVSLQSGKQFGCVKVTNSKRRARSILFGDYRNR